MQQFDKISASLFLLQVLHGEQYTEILSPLPTSGQVRLTSNFVIADVADRGRNMAVVVDVFTRDATSGKDLIRNQLTILIMGESCGKKTDAKSTVPIQQV